LFKRALEINEKALGKEHPSTATSLNNLANLYQATGRYAEAKPLLKRALEINEKALGKEHPSTATSLNNLANLYQATGRYAEAEPLLKRALEINEKALGKEHPSTATSLNNLASLYYNTGRYDEAEPLYKRALEINEKALGKEHPDTVISLNNLAKLYAVTNRHKESDQSFNLSIVSREKNTQAILNLLSDRQKLNYIKETRSSIDGYISHTAGYMLSNNKSVYNTFNEWLKWKNIVMEAQGRYIDTANQSDNPEIQKLFDELKTIRRTLASLYMSGPKDKKPEEHIKRIKELETKKEALEAELSTRSKDFALQRKAGKVDIKALSGILSTNSIYIDYAQIDNYNFKEKKWGKPTYFVFVLVPGKEPVVKLIEIGTTDKVDEHIKSYLTGIKDYGNYLSTNPNMTEATTRRKIKQMASDLSKDADAIYEIAVKPIESYIKGKKNVYISPDGNLNLIPFEVLKTPDGKYLMEQYDISYVGAGRDIVRFTDTEVAKGSAMIFADPDYDLGLTEKDKTVKEMQIADGKRSGSVSRGLKGMRFNRLPDTKKEADGIEKVLKGRYKINVDRYQDKKALEEALFVAKKASPKVLHLSTHGYFLPAEKEQQRPERWLSAGQLDKLPESKIENPMLRSGVVLAGVNTAIKENRDDGLISAEKVLGMKLKGTDLVVLSACDTGVGDVQSGEGVFGLKRSFILSGAKTVVMSLWSVPSNETTELMVDFYTLMAEGKSKAEALKQAKFNMMKKKENPFFWGAFILVGKTE
ncbi:MAG: CHAT domain-containing protein, partial [Nitrospirae bacterium]|nr:CHAT domain-containing protein [Nitrospirota bacterium]